MSLPSTAALSTGYFFRACTAAFTKKPMKPIFTPCSLVNASWNFLRICITGAMFTSLNVVRMALVDCDCSRRSATRARRRLIATRCSGRSTHCGLEDAGAGTWGSTLAGTPVGMAGVADAGGAEVVAAEGVAAAAKGVVAAAKDVVAAAPRATAPSTSALVTRPSLPVPGTDAADSWWLGRSLGGGGRGAPGPGG